MIFPMILVEFMNISQSEIWEVDFFPNIGSEIAKNRPALIVNHNLIGKLPLRTIVPVTEWADTYSRYPWMVKIIPDESNKLIKVSAIDCFQIKNFSIERFRRKLGIINNMLLIEVHKAILKTLNPGYILSITQV